MKYTYLYKQFTQTLPGIQVNAFTNWPQPKYCNCICCMLCTHNLSEGYSTWAKSWLLQYFTSMPSCMCVQKRILVNENTFKIHISDLRSYHPPRIDIHLTIWQLGCRTEYMLLESFYQEIITIHQVSPFMPHCIYIYHVHVYAQLIRCPPEYTIPCIWNISFPNCCTFTLLLHIVKVYP